jgi:hypothetical protein
MPTEMEWTQKGGPRRAHFRDRLLSSWAREGFGDTAWRGCLPNSRIGPFDRLPARYPIAQARPQKRGNASRVAREDVTGGRRLKLSPPARVPRQWYA